MRHPHSTYRLQIRESFTLDDAAEVTDYLRDLGISWAYLSPILEATPGSDHGYDVVNVTRVDPTAAATVREANWFLAVLSGALPKPVSSTAISARDAASREKASATASTIASSLSWDI